MAKKEPFTIRCTCGKGVVVSRLKTHLKKSIFHWQGKGWKENDIPPEELEAMANEILLGVAEKARVVLAKHELAGAGKK